MFDNLGLNGGLYQDFVSVSTVEPMPTLEFWLQKKFWDEFIGILDCFLEPKLLLCHIVWLFC